MSIPYKTDDYVFVNWENKHKLGLVLNKKQVMLEDGVEEDDTTETIQISPEQIILNIGPNPEALIGKSILGRKIEFYSESMNINNWPVVHLYRKWDEKQKGRDRKFFVQVFNRSFKMLKEKGLHSFIENMKCIRLRNKAGKYAGSYTYKRNKDHTFADEICLMPEDLLDRKYMLYVVMHECAHGIWHHLVPEDLKARWIRLYSKRIDVDHFDEGQMALLKKSLVKYEGTYKDYIKEMADEDEKLLIKESMSWIRRVHKISDKEFLQLCALDATKAYDTLWPEYADLGTPTPDITEYAMTKPDEFFAEAFAFYMTDQKLPSDVTKAMDKTLKACKRY